VIELALLGVLGLGAKMCSEQRGVYGTLVAWWKGAFTPDNAAIAIANMIDSDINCEWWEDNAGHHRDYYHHRTFRSEHLKTSVYYYYSYSEDDLGSASRVKLEIDKKNEKGVIKFPVSSYDDYKLVNAVDRWRKRKRKLDKMRELRKSEDLVNERVTKGYIDQVEMIEKRILGREDADTANELRACLIPPEKPKEEEVKASENEKLVKLYAVSDPTTKRMRKPGGSESKSGSKGPSTERRRAASVK
jgi:hypothetical protein